MKGNMIMKKASERRIVKKVKNGAKENIALDTERMNKTDKLSSPDLLLQMTLLPPLTVWTVQWWAGRSVQRKGLYDEPN